MKSKRLNTLSDGHSLRTKKKTNPFNSQVSIPSLMGTLFGHSYLTVQRGYSVRLNTLSDGHSLRTTYTPSQLNAMESQYPL